MRFEDSLCGWAKEMLQYAQLDRMRCRAKKVNVVRPRDEHHMAPGSLVRAGHLGLGSVDPGKTLVVLEGPLSIKRLGWRHPL